MQHRYWLLLLGCAFVIACSAPTVIPPGGQAVTVSSVEGQLGIGPALVRPGDVYLVLQQSAPAVNFVHRTADMNDPQSPPLPVSEDDLRSLEEQGSFQGAVHDALGVGGHGNVFRVGPLVPGKYALMIDRNETDPLDPALISVAVLEVRGP